VSSKHANFIQADAGGRADDVFALMGEVRRRVRTELGVTLEPETRLIGFGRELR
jgi:UDP-N-acetylmuramate dehydrogenase